MMRTAHKLECPECSHVGKLIHAENDQPFTRNWERYRVEGIVGREYYVEPWATWEQVFENITPTCPQCDHNFTVGDLLGLNN